MSSFLPIVDSKFIADKFTVKLKELRNAKGFTQEQIADILGVGIKTYRSWEKGTLPKTTDLFNLANILECDVDYLLGKMSQETHLKDFIYKNYSLSPESFDKLGLLNIYKSTKVDSDRKRIANDWVMILEYLIRTEDGNFMLDQMRQYANESPTELGSKYSYFALLHGRERQGKTHDENWELILDIIDSLKKMQLYMNRAVFTTPVDNEK